jgi:hypothetical protein
VARIQDYTLHMEAAGVLEMMTNYYKNKTDHVTEMLICKLYKIWTISYHICKHQIYEFHLQSNLFRNWVT